METVTLQRDTRSTILASGRTIMSRKGFSAVGLAEILGEARVPKGSFYHFFESKDAFGVAMLESYFSDYVAEIDELFARNDLSPADRLLTYFANWREHQGAFDLQGRCLAVKLGAEVSDLSEPMRLALKSGTNAIIARLEDVIKAGGASGAFTVAGSPRNVATALYHQWLGASVMAKILRTHDPFETALDATRQLLGLHPS
jgi:TetR/AcrR family transcriptional repressor of nem operon